ncbi:hypothetical protein HPS36_02075 [Halorubrum salinarum]|uniref:Uncharacterized protein n=1 Tax=Halorubrum salinarum TaxID=2739057 RepID=A0A7D3YDX0_9EURY|nr:hypothetical protein [Halorubrum salinarum]QKG91690.1 hypothetical protein HPS36_02075 [Halorubrum salinarum]
MTDDFDDDLIDDDILDESDDEREVRSADPDDSGGFDATESATSARDSIAESASTARDGISDAREALEPRARAAGERVGELSGRALGASIAFLVSMASALVYTVTKFLPFIGEKFWKSAIETCVVRYQKAAGADVVNFVFREQGKVEPVATKWHEGEDTGEKPGWKAVGEEKVWDPGAEGRGVERLGKADVIFSDEAAWHTADPLKMRVSEALDLENVEPLVTNATLQQNIISANTNGDGKAAMADGGAQAGPITLDPHQHQAFDDFAIDLSPDNPAADGMRISGRKYKEMDLTKTSAEEMKNQETRGFLAGRAGTDNKSLLLKIVLAAFGFVLLWEFGPNILAAIFGESAANLSGGANIPLMLDATTTLMGVA